MTTAAAWLCIEKLFKLVDKSGTGKLNLDQLVDFVAEVRKMDIVPVDEGYIVQNLQNDQLEEISFEQFKTWSCGPDDTVAHEEEVMRDPFGNTNIVPNRFMDASSFVHNAKVQHPCFTTTSHEIGQKKPQQVDMPVKWGGKEGHFTQDFVMQEPGKASISINAYVNRGLRTNKTYSKVHTELDIDF